MSLNMQQKNGRRGIEWTDATWNPIKGCVHQCRWEMPNGEIAVCYAEDVAEGIAKASYPNGFDAHYWNPTILDSPTTTKSPLKIFVGSMSDVFGAQVPSEQIQAVLDVANNCPEHTFQFLTKNVPRVNDFKLPPNVWIGASMPPDFMFGKRLSRNSQARMLERMLKLLTDTRASVRWMSFEPLSWNVSEIVAEYPVALDWAVIGAASSGRKKYPPEHSHFDALCDVLNFQEVPIFYKGNLSSLPSAKTKWREDFPRPSLVQLMKDDIADDIRTKQSKLF